MEEKARVGELRAASSRYRNDLAHALSSVGVDLVRLPGDRVLRIVENATCKTITPAHVLSAVKQSVLKFNGQKGEAMSIYLAGESGGFLRDSVQTVAQKGEVLAANSAAAKRKSRDHGPPVEGNLETLPAWVAETVAQLEASKTELALVSQRLKCQRLQEQPKCPPCLERCGPPLPSLVPKAAPKRKKVLLKDADKLIQHIVDTILLVDGDRCRPWDQVEAAVAVAVNEGFC